MQRKPFLVIGCGRNDSEAFANDKISHQKLHPSAEFDTLNISSQCDPSYLFDINKSEIIAANFPKSHYQLVVLERFPVDKEYFMPNTAISIQHLIHKDGMVIFMPTGPRIPNFDYLITTMMQAGFNKCVVSKGASLMFFLKCENNVIALERIRSFTNTVPYVAGLLKLETLIRQPKDDMTNLEHHLWDCNALHEAYLQAEAKGKKPRAPEIEAIITTGQLGQKEPKETKEPKREMSTQSSTSDLLRVFGVQDQNQGLDKRFEALPQSEALQSEAPKSETPKSEAPKSEAPKSAAPKSEAPKSEALLKDTNSSQSTESSPEDTTKPKSNEPDPQSPKSTCSIS